jgi:hypothetical protein
MRFLQHNAETRLQPMQATPPIIHAVDPNTSGRRFVKPAKQLRNRALPSPGFANQRDALSAANPNAEVLQHRPTLRIGKRRVVKNDFADSSLRWS